MRQEDDDRVSDTPFIDPRPLSAEERMQVHQLGELEQEFLSWLDRLGKQRGGMTRFLSLARTNIEQGVMWARRGITERG